MIELADTDNYHFRRLNSKLFMPLLPSSIVQLFIKIGGILLQFNLIWICITDPDENRNHISRWYLQLRFHYVILFIQRYPHGTAKSFCGCCQQYVLNYAPDRGKRIQSGYIGAIQFLALEYRNDHPWCILEHRKLFWHGISVHFLSRCRWIWPRCVQILFRIELIIKKIIENYETEMNYSEDRKPEFFSDSSQFSVILKNLNYGKSIENLVIDSKNQAIKTENTAIESQNPAIETAISKMNANKNTRNKAVVLFKAYGTEGVFGRNDIATLIATSYSSAGELIAKLKDSGLITEVKGQGKGKYKFNKDEPKNV